MRGKSAQRLVGPRIAELARRQHGVVARGQLVDLGIGADVVDRWHAAGRLHAIHRGVYALGHSVLGGRGNYMAAVLACGPGAALSHTDAAAHLDLRARAAATIHVSVRTRNGRRRRPGLHIHRCVLAPEDVTKKNGIAVTTVARTLVDIATVLPGRDVERALGESERLGLFDLGPLERLLARGLPGTRVVREILATRAEPVLVRSELELRFLELCHRAGLSRPEVNVSLLGYEIDFLWRAQRLAVETDGRATHSTTDAFESDRERDVRLTAAGWRPVRFSYRQVTHRPAYVSGVLTSLLGGAQAAMAAGLPARPRGAGPANSGGAMAR